MNSQQRAIMSGSAAVLGVITLRIMHGIPISEQTRNDRICTGFAFVFLSMNTLSFIYHLCV